MSTLIGKTCAPESSVWQQPDASALTTAAAVAAGFTGLLSLFNIGGRFFWASISDYLGRKKTFTLFFVPGAILYLLTIFAAYLADQFGTQMVGAIHGRLVTQRTTRWFLANFAESREDPLIDLILTLTIAGGSLAAALYITRHWRQ